MLNLFGFWETLLDRDNPWLGIIGGSILVIVGIIGLIITRRKRRQQENKKK